MINNFVLENGLTVIPDLDIGQFVMIYDYDTNRPVLLEVVAIGYDEKDCWDRIYYVGRSAFFGGRDNHLIIFNLDDVNYILEVDEVLEEI